MLSKLISLVFINTTASSKVVNHASSINVFSCKNSQLELPPNCISQIDRRSIALSLEYYFCNESHEPGRGFRPLKNGKIDSRDYTDLDGNLKKNILKTQIEIF